jgi:hypothetical protein
MKIRGNREAWLGMRGAGNGGQARNWCAAAVLAVLAFAVLASESADRPLPRYSCGLARSAVGVDGQLEEEAWRAADAVVLRSVCDGTFPEHLTIAMMCRDARNLYIAFRCEDQDIWSDFRRRDEHLWEGEVVEAFIGTGKDATRYFEFEVSPRNVVWDGRITNPGDRGAGIRMDSAWNCEGLRTAISVMGNVDDKNDRDRRWTAEMAIPFRSISVGGAMPKTGESWRINLFRIEKDRVGREPPPNGLELSAWSPAFLERPDFHVPSRFGFLDFRE